MVFVIVHSLRPTSKGLDHPYLHVYACLLLCFMFVLASLILAFAMSSALHKLDLVWLHPTSMRCYAYHACLYHLLALYASLHACLHVHAWVLLANVLSILQYNEVMDIRSKSIFVPPQTPSFACLLSCLLASLFVCLLVHLLILLLVMSPATCYACFFCMLVCFMPIAHYLRISFFPLLVCWFFVFTFA